VIAPRVIHLRDVVDGLARMVARTIGEDVVLAVDLGDDVPPVLADPGRSSRRS